MSIHLIVILVFIAGFILMAILYRNATLDKLPKLSGENTLLEEMPVKVSQGGSSQTTIFTKCLVRVTNYRIIVAQKPLLGKTLALRHVITYNEYSHDTDLKKTLLCGYMIFKINKSDVKIIENSENNLIQIDIPNSTLTKGQYLEFTLEKFEEFKKLFL